MKTFITTILFCICTFTSLTLNAPYTIKTDTFTIPDGLASWTNYTEEYHEYKLNKFYIAKSLVMSIGSGIFYHATPSYSWMCLAVWIIDAMVAQMKNIFNLLPYIFIHRRTFSEPNGLFTMILVKELAAFFVLTNVLKLAVFQYKKQVSDREINMHTNEEILIPNDSKEN